MHIVLLAPGAGAPWTEGRKNLVRDLYFEFLHRGHDVSMLSGISMDAGGLRITLSSLFQCWACFRGNKPDLLICFPYGRFRGLRGAVNIFFAISARMLSALFKVRVLTLLYSADGRALSSLRKLFGPLAAIGCDAKEVAFVHLGLAEQLPRWTGSQAQVPRLLFLCGYQQARYHSVRGVLEERGFRLLMEALSRLRTPVHLTVAIPFLRDAGARAALAKASTIASNVEIQWQSDGDPRMALAAHDAFIFPYQAEHEVFVPTSMLEAMAIGIPVVATDLAMYGRLTRQDGLPGCFLFPPGDSAALAACIEQFLQDPAAAGTMAERQRNRITEDWNIARTADDVLRASAVCD